MIDDGRLGDYRLVGLLGRGGMGEVHRAVDTRRARPVALKVLRPDVADDPEFRERFRREAGATAAMQSPHIVPIHDFGEIDGHLFIDMPLIHGMGLDAVLGHGPLAPHRAVTVIGQVAEGLVHAHGHGVLHRDVKPSNILLTPADFVYLVDFGIAYRAGGTDPHLTATGTAIGTWAYMAPERFDAGAVDARSDVYSLACVLAECLLGRRPFDGTGPASLMKAHLAAEPPRPSRERPDIPPALDEVIARGMAKDPAHRFGSARELAAAAAAALSAPASTRVRPTTHDAARPAAATSRRRLVLAGVGAAALAMTLAAGIGLGRMTDGATAATPSPVADTGAAATGSSVARPPTTPEARSGTVFGAGQSDGYTYTVDANYPVHLIYTDAAGDQVTAGETPAPWSLVFDTSRWGSDARPQVSAYTMSNRGDSYVECTITDADGRVVVTQRKETANAMVMCMAF
ncbi:serine/threonine-protein kinase [Pseudonocardia spirodelae]|uniref:non-specific serine/threonine protein kinase n=1 Tax=Pseudonocardia spirodelae TaxID=3133431 RepID=A0ABU8T0W2_9PSEU